MIKNYEIVEIEVIKAIKIIKIVRTIKVIGIIVVVDKKFDMDGNRDINKKLIKV